MSSKSQRFEDGIFLDAIRAVYELEFETHRELFDYAAERIDNFPRARSRPYSPTTSPSSGSTASTLSMTTSRHRRKPDTAPTTATGMDIGDIPRGEDFSNKFARGEWAETVLIETIERQDRLFGFQYGVSRGDALETKDELDELKEPGVEEIKRPDVLVYEAEDVRALPDDARRLVERYISGGPDERADLLPELERSGAIHAAEMALEAESSKFRIDERQYNSSLSAYVKDEDYPRLQSWRDRYGVPIFVCQLFYDRAYIIPFAAYEEYAEQARRCSAPVPGFEHDTIPVIRKDGLQAKVEDFPHSEPLGTFEEDPSVVRRTPDGIEECDYSWSRSGQLDAECDSAFFAGGKLSIERPLSDYT